MVEQYLSTPAAAAALGIDRKTLTNWCKAGKIEHIRLGRLFKIPVDEIPKALKRAATPAASTQNKTVGPTWNAARRAISRYEKKKKKAARARAQEQSRAAAALTAPARKRKRDAERSRRKQEIAWEGHSSFNAARRRGLTQFIPFDLVPDEVEEMRLRAENCPACNRVFGPGVRRSLDKLVPSLGYVSGNVHWICYGCNVKKTNNTAESLAGIVLYMQDNGIDVLGEISNRAALRVPIKNEL